MKWHAKYNWNYSAYEDPLVPTNAYDAKYWQRELYTSLAVMYTPNEHWAFDYSIDYALNNLNSSSTQTINLLPYRHTLLQSGTARYKSDRLTVLGRLLHSLYLNFSKFGKSARNMRRFSPSVSLSYQLLEDEELYVRASYKNIFRSPTFNESYYFHYGSPDLLPESTDQYNIGVTWSKKTDKMRVQLTADGYYNHVKDMIVAVPYNMFIWTCINVGKVRVLGADVTVDGSYDLGHDQKLLFNGSYSYQKAENRTTEESEFYGNQIAYIPEHTGSIAIGWENPVVSLSLHGSGLSSRWDNNQHTEGSLIEGYWDTGITAYHTFCWSGQKLEVRLDIKNILNKQYEIVHFYPMPGRSWQASVKYQL
jgi:outer membrane receptor protein involved in Fe transport